MKKVMHIFGILLLGFFLSACQAGDEEKVEEADESIPVETVFLEKGDLTVDRKIYGRTSPHQITPIIIPMPGELDELNVSNGDVVDEDDLIATLKTERGNLEIRAPKKGEIFELDASEGDFVSETDPLALITDMRTLNVNFSVTDQIRLLFERDESYDAHIRDHKVSITIDEISSMPNDSGLYSIQGQFENNNDEIIPGMIVELTISETKVTDAYLLPTSSIIEDHEGTYIYVLEDGRAVKTEIEIIESLTEQTAFQAKDLEEGNEIIDNGQLTVSDGSKVHVVEGANES